MRKEYPMDLKGQNCQKRAHQELQNEPPLDSLEPLPKPVKPACSRPSPEAGHKRVLVHQVGAHFKALNDGVLVAPSKFIGYFFPFKVFLKWRNDPLKKYVDRSQLHFEIPPLNCPSKKNYNILSLLAR